MAAESTLEPTIPREEENDQCDESDEGDESDIYEFEGEEEGDSYQPEEDGDDEDDKGASDVEEPGKNMIALLLGNQNGTTETEEDDEEDDEDYDEDYDEDDEYQEDGEGTAEDPIDLSSPVVGSKRGVDELAEGAAYGDDDDEGAEGETVAKKARV